MACDKTCFAKAGREYKVACDAQNPYKRASRVRPARAFTIGWRAAIQWIRDMDDSVSDQYVTFEQCKQYKDCVGCPAEVVQ